MGHAKYTGRLGVLAVSLGIGVAEADGTGYEFAGPANPNSPAGLFGGRDVGICAAEAKLRKNRGNRVPRYSSRRRESQQQSVCGDSG
jgi:hypothetical protein